MTAITIKGVRKTFGSTVAVDSIDLSIRSKDLFFLLGPSGCGKTTLLRILAGFIEPTAGRVLFGDRDVTHLPPNRRNTGMVFQSYALWPHMNVFENVAFGLGVRKVAADEKRDRVARALKLVQMQEYEKRKPNELSGGQQQRVALARALVIEPTVLLLDEPLSNLDAKLRLEMRTQIRRICTQTGITTVYVTHDQKEALSMADDIAVLRHGKVMQVGPPRQLYDRPATRFVADFLGETNFLHAAVATAENGRVVLETPAGRLRSTAFDQTTPRGGNVTCSIRPETLQILGPDSPGAGSPASSSGADGEGPNVLEGRRTSSTFLGEVAQHLVALPDGTILKVLELNPAGAGPASGAAAGAGAGAADDRIRLAVRPEHVVILPD